MKQALTGPDAGEWLSAMVEEMKSILKNDTWKLVKSLEAEWFSGTNTELMELLRGEKLDWWLKVLVRNQAFISQKHLHL
jgi:hypothetical protein